MRSLCICVLILGIAILPIKGGEGCRMIVSDGNMSCYAEKIANLKLIHDFVTQNTKFAKGVSAPFAGCIGEDLVIAGGCNFPDVPILEHSWRTSSAYGLWFFCLYFRWYCLCGWYE